MNRKFQAVRLKRFRVGDKVRMKNSLAEWYLSEEGQDIFYPPSGILDNRQEMTLDLCNIAVMSSLMDKSVVGEVVNSWIDYGNPKNSVYRIEIMGAQFNVNPESLVRIYGV
jgi:hypothetical protein